MSNDAQHSVALLLKVLYGKQPSIAMLITSITQVNGEMTLLPPAPKSNPYKKRKGFLKDHRRLIYPVSLNQFPC